MVKIAREYVLQQWITGCSYTTKTKYGKQRTNCWVSNNGCQQADVEA